MKIEKESSEQYFWGEHCESWVLQPRTIEY